MLQRVPENDQCRDVLQRVSLKNDELRKKSESTAAKQLADLKKKQLVEYRGANKTGGYYVIQHERMADRY